jgi:hypothetical protein
VEIELPFCDPVSISDKSVERSKSLTEEKSDIIASELRQSASNWKPSFFFFFFGGNLGFGFLFLFFQEEGKRLFLVSKVQKEQRWYEWQIGNN